MENKIKTPVSWYIWLALWILPLVIAFGIYETDPWAAGGTWIGSGVLVALMLLKPKWVLPWFCVILIFDLIGYGALFTQEGEDIAKLVGALLKELVFLGYLLFSKNAKRYQGWFQLPTQVEAE